MLGHELKAPTDAVVYAPPYKAKARFQRRYAASATLADEWPEVIANPEAARGLEQDMLCAMVSCLAKPDISEDASSRRRHSTIMRRFRQVLEAHRDRGPHIPELCAELRVSDRPLRGCCQESVGMSPYSHLSLRKMHLARRALTRADASATSA
jgi:AraC-like DNA-binding protein